MTLEIRVWVSTFLYPQLPIGNRMIAEVGPGQSCVTIPDSLSLTVTGPTDSTTYHWTPASPIYLAAIDSTLWHATSPSQAGLDSAHNAIYPYDGILSEIGETNQFTPNDSPGWTVSFPARPQFSVQIAKTSACTP